LKKGIKKFAPGWKVTNWGNSMEPGLHRKVLGRKNVLVTHPAMDKTACVLSKTVKLDSGKPVLKLSVGHHPEGDWDLIVKANGKELLKKSIGKDTANKNGWLETEVDLSKYAGKKVKLELLNQASGWKWEGAYWGKIELLP
jgi:hypothetical protein